MGEHYCTVLRNESWVDAGSRVCPPLSTVFRLGALLNLHVLLRVSFFYWGPTDPNLPLQTPGSTALAPWAYDLDVPRSPESEINTTNGPDEIGSVLRRSIPSMIPRLAVQGGRVPTPLRDLELRVPAL